MAANNIRGNTDVIAQNGQKLMQFGEDLNGKLDTIKGVVDEIAAATYGLAQAKLTDTYYQLHADLKKYAEQLEVLGQNVQTSSRNLDAVDEAAASGLSYE